MTHEHDTLRVRAQTRLDPAEEDTAAMSPEQTQRILHELRVHQVELEMQNEELRRTQVELEASQTRYFDLYDLAPVGYLTLSEHGLILQTNLSAATLLGVPRGTLVKQPLSRLILKADQDNYYLYRKRIFETGEPQACELRMVKNDGTQIWARLAATVAQDAEGRPISRVVLDNITERKEAEETLRESENSLRESQAIAKLGSYVLDIPAGLWRSSEVLDALFGIDESYARTVEGWGALIHPADRAMMLEYFQNEVLGRKRPFDKEYRVIRPRDQVECWVHGLGKVEFDARGLPLRMHGTIQDITERRQAQQEQSLRLEELRRWYDVTLGRESRIAELKHEVNALAARLGESPPYDTPEETEPKDAR